MKIHKELFLIAKPQEAIHRRTNKEVPSVRVKLSDDAFEEILSQLLQRSNISKTETD